MCEGKFLVKTNVSDNHVIRQVTVENFRFGVRVVKKTEGCWTCQDLNVTESGSGSASTSYHSLPTERQTDDGILKRNDDIFEGTTSTCSHGNNSVIQVETHNEKTQQSEHLEIARNDQNVGNIDVNRSPVPQEERRTSSKLYAALSAATTASSAPHTSSLPICSHQGTEDSDGERRSAQLPIHAPVKQLFLHLSSSASASTSKTSSTTNSNSNFIQNHDRPHGDFLNTDKLPPINNTSDAGVGSEQTVAANNDLRSLTEIPSHSVLRGPTDTNTNTNTHTNTHTNTIPNTNSNNHSILYNHLRAASESVGGKNETRNQCLKYSSTSTSLNRTTSISPTTKTKLRNIISGPRLRVPPSNIYSCPTQTQNQNRKSPTEFSVNDTNSDTLLKNPYLTKILGNSPLLKLQLLNLLVVPLDDQRNKFPDLIPRQNISRLKMLFDDDGNERVGSGSETDREQKRSRDKDSDDEQLDLKKRVKMEPEDEDNLVIDENMGYGEELSENDNSEDLSNDNDDTARMDLLEVGQQNSVNVTCVTGGNRSSSDSSYTSSTRNKLLPSSNSNSIKFAKNGHDTNVSKVPKLSSSQTVSSKFNSNYDECNNLGDNAESNSSGGADSKMLRLEREIAALTSLLKTKEKEWNTILRLKKLKEMNMEFLRRQKDVDELFDSETVQQHEEYLKTLTDRINSENDKIGSDEAQVRLSIEKTEKEIKIAEKKIKNNRVHVSAGKRDQSKDLKQNDAGHMDNFKASLALQQLCERNRTTLVQANSPVQLSSGSPNMQNKVIGEGRQGTIVEVRSIIADYRSKNPEETGQSSEARRRVQKKGSSTTQAGGSSIISQNRNVSFKDVLVNLAKLSQNEKTSGPLTATANDTVTVNPRGTSKTNSSMLQANSYGTSRGQLGTTLAKLLSSNSSSSNIPVGIVHPDGGGSVSSIKIDSINHTGDSNLSLANLLASAKCRDDEIKTEEDDMVPICQGCNANRAQFVCAGCGNQWYCCRECQIQAWEDHSEVCSG